MQSMFSSNDVDSIASVTELRTDTMGVIEHSQDTDSVVGIVRNNRPEGVVLSWELYQELKEEAED